MAKHRKRRALATVVSTGILLSAVAIMGSMLTAWSNSIFATEQHQLNTVYADGVNKLNENLVIEHVWFGNETNPENKFLNITISNVGNVGLNVTKITLDDKIKRADLLINNGGIVRDSDFSTVMNYDWTTTEPIQITLTTEKGKLYQTFVMGP
jgi:archaellum component FlaF (FlaF/FlaG flagellin family)